MKKLCEECGSEFEAKLKTQRFCKADHYRICSICSQSYYVKFSNLSSGSDCCSQVCAVAKGVRNRGNKVYELKCKECGKLFSSDNSRQVFCDDVHYRPCPICGKSVEVRDLYDLPMTCSPECNTARRLQTTMERYGRASVGCSSDESKSKRIQTSIERFGVPYVTQSEQMNRKPRY